MSRCTPIAIALLLAAGAATAVAQSVQFHPSRDIPVENGGVLNDYTYTHESDNQYEGITELRTGGAPHEKRTYLVHKWAIPVNGTYDSWALHLEAYHTFTEGSGYDDFIFAWSPDNNSYYNLFTVTKTSDDDTEQVCRFYPPPTDTVYIRVTDTVPNGFQGRDTIYVDHMYIENYHDNSFLVISDVAHAVSDHAWVNLSPAVNGGPLVGRERFAMAYHSRVDKIILFGGGTDSGFANDTWIYDYATNTWSNAQPQGELPAPRFDHAMAYDQIANKVFLFGGGAGSPWTTADDMWEYDYGYANGVGRLGDTWAYDAGAQTWHNLSPTVGPSPRAFYAMAYAGAGRTVLFGGITEADPRNDETWLYDSGLNTWANMTPGDFPPGRVLATMTYVGLDQIVLFGGNDGNCQLNDTWAYDVGSDDWYQLGPDQVGGELRVREAPSMVYDEGTGKPILFGGWTTLDGCGGGGATCLNDTWEYVRGELVAEVSWHTDELSDSVVHYGPTQALGLTASDPTFVTNHVVVLGELEPETIYYYQVQSTDTGGNTTIDPEGSPYHQFSTVIVPNRAPAVPSDPSPADDATPVGLDVNLSVYVSDPDADEMDVSFYDELGGLIGTAGPVGSGERASVSWEGLAEGTTYGWYAVADDLQAPPARSETWHFTTTTSGVPGAMYVWDISWNRRQSGPHAFVTHIITVRYDSDQDGIAEESDELVDNATVYSTLRNTATQDSWSFSGVTANGVVEFTQRVVVTYTGPYEAHVTDITHDEYDYTPEMDVDNPDYFSI
jgi:hypothetical protein